MEEFMLKKILIFAMLSMPAFAVNCFAYSDVGADDQYYTQINELSEAGIISGYDDDTFRPNAPITRSEFTKLFCGAMDINEGSGKKYTDVDADFWGAKYIDSLSSAGIINGYEDGTFRPNDNICFKDAVKMAVCAKDLEDIAEAKGSYPNGYMETAQQYLLTENITGMEDISANITRGQVAALLYNAKNKKYCRLTQRVYGDYYNGYVHYGAYPREWEGIRNNGNIYNVWPNVYRKRVPEEERITVDGINYQVISRDDAGNFEWLALPKDKPYIDNYHFDPSAGCFVVLGDDLCEDIAYSYDLKTWYDESPGIDYNADYSCDFDFKLPFDESKEKLHPIANKGKPPYIVMEIDELLRSDKKYYSTEHVVFVSHRVYVSRDGMSWTILALPPHAMYVTFVELNADNNSFVVSCEVPLDEKEQQYVDEVEQEAISQGMIYDKPVSKTENYMIPFEDIT